MYKKIIVPMALDHGIADKTVEIARTLLAEGGEIIALHVHETPQNSVGAYVDESVMESAFAEIAASDIELATAFRADIAAVYDRDPACQRYLDVFLYFKGFHALAAHRFAHLLLKSGRRDFALHLQSESSRHFSVDINPAARIGKGIMIDHSHAIVIGETAVVGDNVSMLHSVTLGGTGKVDGDRHPKIGDGVLIGAGAAVLGNITVGHCSRIASGSVVLKEVPPCKTVAGVPAKIVGDAGCDQPSLTMDHLIARAEQV